MGDGCSSEIEEKVTTSSGTRVILGPLTQANWFIDPLHGSDSNPGNLPQLALKTYAELARRWHDRLILPPVSLFGVFRVVTVTQLTNSPNPHNDPMFLDDVELGPDVFVSFNGAAATVDSSGTFTAVSLLNRGTPALPTSAEPTKVTDAARTTPWPEHKRIRIVGGPRDGAISFVAEDLGGNQAATMAFNLPGFIGPGGTPVDPQPGDSYVIENLTQVVMGSNWSVSFAGNATFILFPIIFFNDFDFVAPTGNEAFNIDGGSATGVLYQFNACRIEPFATFFSAFVAYNATALRNGGFFGLSAWFMNAGGAFRELSVGTLLSYNVHCGSASVGTIDGDTMCYGGPMWHVGPPSAVMFQGFAATFKSQTMPMIGGHPGCGMMIFPDSTCEAFDNGQGGATLYGKDNEAVGLLVANTASYTFEEADLATVPTITGLQAGGGDFALGEIGNNVQSTAWDYTVSPPILIPFRPNTWLNVDTPVGGSKGAIDPRTDALIHDHIPFP